MNRNLILALCAVALTAMASADALADVDVSLNLRYNDPADITEGGTYTVVAKTDTAGSSGISGLFVRHTLADANGVVDPAVGHNILGGLLGVGTFGAEVEYVYGQDVNQALTLNVGLPAGPSNQALDPLEEAAWNDASVIATGTFSSSRPVVASAGANEYDGNNSNAEVVAVIGSHVVRGDSVAAQGQGDILSEGDTDRDFDVDTADVTKVLGKFSGSGIPVTLDPGTLHWDNGDFDDDDDVDTADVTAVLGNFTGVLAGLPNNPDLIYDSATGNVSIDADGANVLSFFMISADAFTPPADFTELQADTFNVPGLEDNLPGQIGWVSALAAGGQGYTGANFSPASIGNIFPVGLDLAGVQGLLSDQAWAGPQGAGGAFDLVVLVPEPATLMLFGMGALGMLATRKRR